jgi:ABC-type amino acid transport substrate-binding protein
LALAVWLGHATGAAAWRWRPASGKPLEIRERDRLWEHLPRDEQGGRRVIQAIRDLPGRVWVMHHNYYAWLAGREPGLSIDSARDRTIGGQPIAPAALRMLERGEFDYVVLDNLDLGADWLDDPIRQAIRRHYDFAENWEAKFGFQALRPVDQTAMKPRALWKRRPQ